MKKLLKRRITKIFMLIIMAIFVVHSPMFAARVEASNGNPYPPSYTDDNGVYHPGNCTYTAWEETYKNLGIKLPAWGNAGNWCASAKAAGYNVIDYYDGAIPPANCIIEWSGHVGWCVSADSNGITIKEGNILYQGTWQKEWQQYWTWTELKKYRGNPKGFICPGQSGYVNLGDSFNASIFRTDQWVTLHSDTTTLGTGGRHARSVWSFKRLSNGAYVITSMYDGKVLDVYGAGTSDGTKVWTCDKWVDSSGGNAAQEWYIYPNGSGYRFVPRLVPNKAMTCVHDSYGPKTPMNLQAWISRGSQIFSIYKQTEIFPTGISTSNKTIRVGESATLNYTISPSNTNSKYVGATFSSNDTSVVTVDENGTIKGIKPGTATITVTMAFNERKTAKATITVKECSHSWNSGSTTSQPTCTGEGSKTYKCTTCNATKTEVIDKLGHNYSKSYTIDEKATATVNGSKSKHCTRNGCSAKTFVTTINKASGVKLSTATYTYDGKMKSPTVYIKDSKGNTISSSNYAITKPSGRKNVGKYTYKITFKNAYSGTKTLTFKINPKGTSISSITKASKAFTVKWKKQSTKMETSRITGYQIQYSTSKKFTNPKTVTVSGYSKTSKKITKLSAKKTYYVRVRTYKTVSGTKYYSGWSGYKTVKTK